MLFLAIFRKNLYGAAVVMVVAAIMCIIQCIMYFFARRIYRRFFLYRLIMGERAIPPYTKDELRQIDKNEIEAQVRREEENTLRHKERVRLNAQRFGGSTSSSTPEKQESLEIKATKKRNDEQST